MKKVWDSMSIKWRWRLLIGSILFLLYLSYQLNIKKTIELLSSYQALTVEIGEKEIIVDRHASISEMPVLSDPRNSILTDISRLCLDHNVIITGIGQTCQRSLENFVIETNKITLRGTFTNILTVLNKVEQAQYDVAVINSASWEIKSDASTNKPFLYATLFIKHLKYEQQP